MGKIIKLLFCHRLFILYLNKYSSVNQLENILLKAKNVKLCLREKNSYEFAKTNFESDNVKCYLLPDMALLALNQIKSDVEKNQIAILQSVCNY